MIIVTVPVPEHLVVPELTLARPATSSVESLHLSPPLGATLWLRCGVAARHWDPYLADRYLLMLSVQSRYGIGNVRSGGPEIRFPPGALAVIDPRVTH